jgi:hypothetical protein
MQTFVTRYDGHEYTIPTLLSHTVYMQSGVLKQATATTIVP